MYLGSSRAACADMTDAHAHPKRNGHFVGKVMVACKDCIPRVSGGFSLVGPYSTSIAMRRPPREPTDQRPEPVFVGQVFSPWYVVMLHFETSSRPKKSGSRLPLREINLEARNWNSTSYLSRNVVKVSVMLQPTRFVPCQELKAGRGLPRSGLRKCPGGLFWRLEV